MLDSFGSVVRCIGTLSNITDDRNARERLLTDSVRDTLTRLESRVLFCARLQTLINLAQTSGVLRPIVFFIDIDDFSQINETKGYGVGDTVVMIIARRLEKLLGSEDCVSRLFRDKFAVFVANESNPRKIADFVEEIKKAIGAEIEHRSGNLTLSASIGVSGWNRDYTTAEEMLRDAELAKIEAQRMGRGCGQSYHPALRNSLDDAPLLQKDLPGALEQNQIECFYQPVISVAHRDIVGFETFLRWRHPKLGMLLPSDFIPHAQHCGLINALGVFAVNTAMNDLCKLSRGRDPLPFVGVNIMDGTLLTTHFVKDIANALEIHSINADRFWIEVPETIIMDNPEQTAQILYRLKALGIGISLDGFGTGYSNISRLLEFSFDRVKVNKSFIQARSDDEKSAILRAITVLAQDLNRGITANGIEHEADMGELMQLGCQYAQGRLFGEPAPLERIIAAYPASKT